MLEPFKLTVDNKKKLHFLAYLYECTARAIALTPASALTKMLKFNFQVFKTLDFLNPGMDFVYIWYDYRWRFNILLDIIPTCLWSTGQGHGLRNFMFKFSIKVFKIS